MTGTTLGTRITAFRLTLLACAVALSGCGPMNGDGTEGDAMPASAADPQAVENIREKYRRAYPESQVGVVVETLDDMPLAAVAELPAPASMRANEVVTFLDRHERVLTTGTIVRILPDSVHVRYDSPPRSGREPRRGDIMVRTPFGARAL
jgi:hypothetical protein